MERINRNPFSRALLPAVVFIAAFALVWTPPAVASPVVDQSFTTPWDLGANVNDACKFIGQSFTAGITGTLTGVNIDLNSRPNSSALRVAIRTASGDIPFGDPLAVRYLADPQAPLTRLITFGHAIPVVAGRQYAIVVSYRGGQTRGINGIGTWGGATGDAYAAGRPLSGKCNGTSRFWSFTSTSTPYDLHFRTYVESAAG
jgi:hypothetical protein